MVVIRGNGIYMFKGWYVLNLRKFVWVNVDYTQNKIENWNLIHLEHKQKEIHL